MKMNKYQIIGLIMIIILIIDDFLSYNKTKRTIRKIKNILKRNKK